MVAIAETVLDAEVRYERGNLLRAELPPRGDSIKTPTLGKDAEKLVADCPDARAALVLLGDSKELQRGQFAVSDGTEDVRKPAEINAKALDSGALLAELDALVGLNTVKQQLRKVISVIEANRIRTEAGNKSVPQSLHLVFTGNPGTGKTTVARLVAQLYSSTGALRGNKFKEATRADLVAQYVGHTAQQTERVIKSVTPGVLFIDEAYSLTPSHHGDFAEECIATMVKNMEDHRNEFAVIAAGYKEEMSAFVNSNPGLRSRFQTYIHFEDYTTSELIEIYQRFALDTGIKLASGVSTRVAGAINEAVNQHGFGNARFVRALWEESYANMAVRAAEDGITTREELEEIQPGDVPVGGGPTIGLKRKIGF
ncbi:MAG: hypothetical protein RL254_1110 [Planctomycetota bacterium]